VPRGIPSYQPYCPFTTGPPDGDYAGPDLGKAQDLVKASGTLGMKVTVLDVAGDAYVPLEPYYAHVLRRLGYRVTLLRLPYSPHNEDLYYDPGNDIQVRSGFFAADYPLPSNFYDLVVCGRSINTFPFSYCNRDLDSRAAEATAKLQPEPGAALREWTDIERELTDQAPLVAVANSVGTWVTSEQVGNYQPGAQDIGPLLSQLWVR
jgi:hypothetical protein